MTKRYVWTDAHRAAFDAARFGRTWKRRTPVSAGTRAKLSAAGQGERNSRFNPNRELVRARLKAQRFMRDCIRRLLVNKSSSSAGLLGYTKGDLIAHLERLFEPGMAWSNYGEWHIDHKRSVADFVANGVTDPLIVCALDNLQPLWRRENMSKGSGLGTSHKSDREGASEIISGATR
jgi:hypothetical protein